jgi:enoyl-CoA hydratase
MSVVELSDPILLEIRRSAAIIKFNKPATRNCLSNETLTRLDSILTEVLSRANISTLIFTGSDDTFLSGADIRELSRLDQKAALQFAETGQRIFSKVAEARQLTIAAINGHCMGGGLDFALACNIRVASPSSEFAHPGARLGIITGWGGTQRLPRIVGKTRAIEFFTTARRLGASEALRIGLIHEVDASPVDAAFRLARLS